jgi:excisionase family DNA binding protein
MKAKSMASNMVTVQEAAKQRGVTDTRIYQWIAEGRLTKTDEAYGRRLVDLAEVKALEPLKRGKPSKKASRK